VTPRRSQPPSQDVPSPLGRGEGEGNEVAVNLLPDLADRQNARRLLNANIIVEAGAGTGKTTLLTDRLLFLLLAGGKENQGVDVTRLVALTFTEKAAAEIKARLAGKLGDLLAALEERPLPDERRARALSLIEELETIFHKTRPALSRAAGEALRAMDRAQIGTIHHFASYILQLYPLESGLGPRFEVDAGPAFDEMFRAEWALWLDTELGETPPRRDAWLEVLLLASLEDLEDLARALCGEGVHQGTLGATPAMAERLRRLAADFAALPQGKPAPGSASRILDSIAEVAAHLDELAAGLGNAGPLPALKPYREFKAKTWPKAWRGQPGEEIYDRGLRVAQSTSALSDKLLRKALALVGPFAETFRDAYRRRGLVTFEGLLTRARALVRDEKIIRRELKARFDAILIDEFQDTDPLQGEILLFLAEEAYSTAARWEDIKFAPGKIFVVGDPKQSIYRFRGADIRAYERFTGLLLQQGAVKCHLQANFRSHAGLVDPVNAAFEKILKPVEGLQPAYRPLFPRPGEAPADGVELVLLRDGDGAGKVDAETGAREEARWMARWINAQAGPGGPRRLKDIAVLLRTTSPLGNYLDVFKEEGVRYVVEADRHFYATQEITDFVNLLKVLDEPLDKIALVGLLRSPMAALADAEVLSLSTVDALDYRNHRWKEAKLSPGARGRLESLWKHLRRFYERVGRDPLGEFVETLLRDSFLLELATAAYQGEQTLSNLLKFGRMAADAGDNRGATLKEFIGEVLRSMREFVQEGESPLADEHLDAVRILTIHKAKGLEFSVVFLPNLSAKKGGGQERATSRVDWAESTAGFRLREAGAADAAMALLEEEEKQREEYEQARLLYVALTRAREKMILLGQAEPRDKNSFAALLRGAGFWPAEDESPSALELGGRSIPVTSVKPSAASSSSREKEAENPPVPGLAGLAALWQKRYDEMKACQAQSLFTSPTAEETLVPAPNAATERAAGGAPGAAGLLGELCHRVLRDVDFRNPANLEALLEKARTLLSLEDPDAPWPEILAEARGILDGFFKTETGRRLAASEILGREVPFIAGGDGQVLRGAMDVLFRRDGALWIGDYKTDRINTGGSAARAERYRAQGEAYRAAARRALGEEARVEIIFIRTGDTVIL